MFLYIINLDVPFWYTFFIKKGTLMVHEKNNTHLKRTQNVKKTETHFMGYFLGEGVPFGTQIPQYKGVGYPEWYTIRDYMGCRGILTHLKSTQ